MKKIFFPPCLHAFVRKNSKKIFITALAIFMLSGCERIRELRERDNEDSPGGPAVQTIMFAVNTTVAVQGHISDYIALSGDIIAGTQVDAFSETAGRISEVYVRTGQWVNRGQHIAAVDPSRPGMTFQLSYVEAPISGRIFTLPAQVGMTVSPMVPLARIAGGNALEVRLFVAERFISRMALNLPCEITLDAWPGEIFRGSIRELAPMVDPVSRTMELRVNVSDPRDMLKAGMFAKVRIITERKENVVKIPAAALVSRFGEQYVYVVESDPESPEHNIVRRRTVVPGISIDGELEIQSGLTPGEEVVVRGQSLLDNGVRVNIVERFQADGSRAGGSR